MPKFRWLLYSNPSNSHLAEFEKYGWLPIHALMLAWGVLTALMPRLSTVNVAILNDNFMQALFYISSVNLFQG